MQIYGSRGKIGQGLMLFKKKLDRVLVPPMELDSWNLSTGDMGDHSTHEKLRTTFSESHFSTNGVGRNSVIIER